MGIILIYWIFSSCFMYGVNYEKDKLVDNIIYFFISLICGWFSLPIYLGINLEDWFDRIQKEK